VSKTNRLWRWLGLIFVLSFGALGFLGWQIHLSAPPIPKRVVTADGEVLYTGEQIKLGQQVWMSAGGQQLGTVWGHGSYVAPDWSADWLHREATQLQAILSARQAKATPAMTEADKAGVELKARNGAGAKGSGQAVMRVPQLETGGW
jgi:nitric oxide reductase subunit B